MKFELIINILELAQEFETANEDHDYSMNTGGFTKWILDENQNATAVTEDPYWVGKENGRSAESAISTLLVHMSRYAKSYSKAAIHNSAFSTQEDFIYLINLKAFGSMSKMELIKKNVHEKPVGMLIINRLMDNGWVAQEDSLKDKRSKVITITELGLSVLESQMDKIRQATKIVCADLTSHEKMELIRLLNKLNDFHLNIYDQNIDTSNLLEKASNQAK